MFRQVRVFVVAAALTALFREAFPPLSVAPAAPVPTHLIKLASAQCYFPTQVGATWVYDNDGEEERVTISKVKPEGDAVIVTMEVAVEGRTWNRESRVSATGVFDPDCGGKRLEQPRPDLLTPFKVGDTWRWSGERCFSQWTVEGIETVAVPAGSFEAVRVLEWYCPGDCSMTRTWWYARGIGLVKYDGPPPEVKVLKSFTPAK